MSKSLTKLMNKLSESDQHLINILNQIQEEYGFIPQPLLTELAGRTGVPESQLYGLVSFFNYFRTRPAGKHRVAICYGTACYARGAPLIYDRLRDELELDEEGTSADGLVTVEKVYCVGACSQAPIMIQNGELKAKVKSHQVPFLIQELREEL